MDCGCSLNDYGDGPEFMTMTNPKARKVHKCCECNGFIEKGDLYEYVAGLWDGDFCVFKTCKACAQIRKDVCGSYGNLNEDVYGVYELYLTRF